MIQATRAARVITISALLASMFTSIGVVSADTAQIGTRRASVDGRIQEESQEFAGYISALRDAKSIVGTFTVPTLGSCDVSDQGIYSAIELITEGFGDYADGAVFSYCVDGEPHHDPAFDTTTADGLVFIDEEVLDGDEIQVTSSVRRGKIKMEVRNLTRDWTAKDSFTGFTPDHASSVYYKMFYGIEVLPPLDAGTVPVQGVYISGLELEQTDPTRYVMVDAAGDALVKPTKVKNGTDFKYKYVG